MIKELLVSVEFTNSDIKGMACEFYNTRYNVLAFDKISCNGLKNYQIVDKEEVKSCVSQLISNLEGKLNGAKIKKVILVIPPVNFARKSFVSEIVTEQGFITNKDVDRGITNILNTKVDDNLYVINTYVTKYVVNGITSRIVPIESACQSFKITCELLLADKQLVVDYVTLLSELNIDVLDIGLSSYCVANESLLLEQSIQKNIILLELNKTDSNISYLRNNKIISVEILKDSLNAIIKPIVNKFNISNDEALRFFQYCLCSEDPFYDDAIYSINKSNVNYSFSKRDLFEACKYEVEEFVENIKETIEPIVVNGETSLYVVGAGADCDGLINIMRKEINVSVDPYYPSIPGARNSDYTNVYGSFYAHKVLFDLRDRVDNCVDLNVLNDSLNKPSSSSDINNTDTITTKLKKFFADKNDKNKGID